MIDLVMQEYPAGQGSTGHLMDPISSVDLEIYSIHFSETTQGDDPTSLEEDRTFSRE